MPSLVGNDQAYSDQAHFANGVFLPLLRDELKIHRELVVATLEKRMKDLLQQAIGQKVLDGFAQPSPAASVTSEPEVLLERETTVESAPKPIMVQGAASLIKDRQSAATAHAAGKNQPKARASLDSELPIPKDGKPQTTSTWSTLSSFSSTRPQVSDDFESAPYFHSQQTEGSTSWVTSRVRMPWNVVKSVTEMRKKGDSGRFLPPESRLYNMVHSQVFQAMISVTIVANLVINLIQIEEQADVAFGRKEAGNQTAWRVAEVIFMLIFVAEIILRILGERCYFFLSQARYWNVFDLVLAVQGLVDAVLDLVFVQSHLNFFFARLLRILRIARVMRVLRVMRQSNRIRTMIHNLSHSFATLVWVFFLLLFVTYCFAVIFLNGIIQELNDVNGLIEPDQLLRDNYSSVPQALISLFMGVTGGKDWTELYTPLSQLGWIYGSLFALYIYFVIFGVFNVVTSVFIDATYKAALSDRDSLIQAEIDRHDMYVTACKRFFYHADSDVSGFLSWAEFHEHLQSEQNMAFLRTLELDESQAQVLFKLLDVEETGSVSIDHFVSGCAKLKGEAKSLDVNLLLFENEKMMSRFGDFMHRTTQSLEAIHSGRASLAPSHPRCTTAEPRGKVNQRSSWSRFDHAVMAMDSMVHGADDEAQAS